MANFTLTQEQYQALASLARAGADSIEKLRTIESFLKAIEVANGITRYSLWVQWQEMDQPLPPSANFPAVWPPSQRFYVENLTRPIAKADVQRVLDSTASKPTNVVVTPDPGGLVGWTPIDSFFVT